MSKCGLEISVGCRGKSASLRIDVDRKKKWVVNPSEHLYIGAVPIPACSITQTYKYLSLFVGAKGPVSGVATKLQGYIDNVTRAPLKPQQRLYVLKQHIIPSMFHQLVLAGSTNKLLKFLDVKIRGAIKKWLKLPKDAPDAFIHSSIDEGGLGVLKLRCMIPLMTKARLEKFVTS